MPRRFLFALIVLSLFAGAAVACPCMPQEQLYERHASLDAASVPPGTWGGAVLVDRWIWFGVGPSGPRVVVRDGDAAPRTAPLSHAAYRALQAVWDAMLRAPTPTSFEGGSLDGDVVFFGGSSDPERFRFGGAYCLLPEAPAARLFDLAQLLGDLTEQPDAGQRALVPWIEANARAAHRLAP